jgi:hypothetical protein
MEVWDDKSLIVWSGLRHIIGTPCTLLNMSNMVMDLDLDILIVLGLRHIIGTPCTLLNMSNTMVKKMESQFVVCQIR